MADRQARQEAREQAYREQVATLINSRWEELAAKGAGGGTAAAKVLLQKYLPLATTGWRAAEKVATQGQRSMNKVDRIGLERTLVVCLVAALNQLMRQGAVNRTTLVGVVAEALDDAAVIGSLWATDKQAAKFLAERAKREQAGRDKYVKMAKKSLVSLGSKGLVNPIFDDPTQPMQFWDRKEARGMAFVLLSALMGSGMLTEEILRKSGKPITLLSLSEEAQEMLAKEIARLADAPGAAGPMVCPPLPWSKGEPGGYLLPALQKVNPLVQGARWVQSKEMPLVYQAVNTLQGTAWQVDTRVLDILRQVATLPHLKHHVLESARVDLPEVGEEMQELLLKRREGEATPEEVQEIREFMAQRREAHQLQNQARQSSLRFTTILGEAQGLREEEELYFVWFMDTRGRMYPRAFGLNPQGSDLQKALLRFKYGSAIRNDRQVELWKTNLAQLWGEDKLSYKDSVAWVDAHEDLILRMAEEPLEYTDWLDCDAPWQFIQAAMEYRDWKADPQGFRSHIPINLDGSINGTQHCSAILRNEVTGKAVNLLPGLPRQDLYMETSGAVEEALRASTDLPEVLRPFLSHGIPRAMSKKVTMTVPYGCTSYGVPQGLLDSYLYGAHIEGLPEDKKFTAAWALKPFVWGAVQKTQAPTLAFLQTARDALAAYMAKWDYWRIKWSTPDGFHASQVYLAREAHEVVGWWGGQAVKIIFQDRFSTKGEVKRAVRKNLAAFPPNLIHSLDAAHMREVIRRMEAYGCQDFAMIHDSFGCPIGYADILWSTVREAFLDQYKEYPVIPNLLEEWEVADTVKAPEVGNLDLTGILQSEYAFK